MFNSLKYAKKLEEVGLSREQAEAHIQIMTELIETNLATKQDLKDLEVTLKQDIKDLDTKFDKKFESFENKLIQLEYRMTIKLGTIVSIALGLAIALNKIF